MPDDFPNSDGYFVHDNQIFVAPSVLLTHSETDTIENAVSWKVYNEDYTVCRTMPVGEALTLLPPDKQVVLQREHNLSKQEWANDLPQLRSRLKEAKADHDDELVAWYRQQLQWWRDGADLLGIPIVDSHPTGAVQSLADCLAPRNRR